MKSVAAVRLLAALAQDHRLGIFRLLVQRGPDGLTAGEIADRLGLAPNALSFHLKALTHVRLLKSRPDGRFVIYAADFRVMNGLLAFLTENCCADSKETAPCPTQSACEAC